MFGMASAIIVYFIRMSWTCAIYKEQQPSADCAGKACLFCSLDLVATLILVHVVVAKLQTELSHRFVVIDCLPTKVCYTVKCGENLRILSCRYTGQYSWWSQTVRTNVFYVGGVDINCN